MTTVAAARFCMAADTQLTGSGVLHRVTKLFHLSDGGVISGCGDWGRVFAAIQWAIAGEKGECPSFEESSLILMRPDGVIWLADDAWQPYPINDDHAAIGSGSQGAQVELRRGRTPKQAVEAVVGVDHSTSGLVQVMKVRRK